VPVFMHRDKMSASVASLCAILSSTDLIVLATLRRVSSDRPSTTSPQSDGARELPGQRVDLLFRLLSARF
jgi:hypothetical protein